MSESPSKLVTFIQYESPPLKSGEYEITVEQSVNQGTPDHFSARRRFAVTGERFAIKPAEIHSVSPPNLANGEFAGRLPHVVFNRRTLPWERTAIKTKPEAPWLAILLFNDAEVPKLQQLTAKDLIKGEIKLAGSQLTGQQASGCLPKSYFSYPDMNNLDYGETPDDLCTVIDINIDLFNKIAPSAEDLPYLAHLRQADTTDSQDHPHSTVQYAVIIGNRIPLTNVTSHAFLVSLENFGDYLPDTNTMSSNKFPAGTKYIRLISYNYWRFTANTMGESFRQLLENLNRQYNPPVSCLQFPVDGLPPTKEQVDLALNHQAGDGLTADDALVLVRNAATMGYVPLDHHLRHGGHTVSWYRGPLVPYAVETTVSIPVSCPDAANCYDPQTGMFDVSYGAAWQLGQLLALQNRDFATTLYNWKQSLRQQSVITAEQAIINRKLNGARVFDSIFNRSETTDAAQPAPVWDKIVQWLAKLQLLNGIPFNYLVPDAQMLPPESLRFFHLDFNWIDCLVDGAFSIGRTSAREIQRDARHLPQLRQAGVAAIRNVRHNPAPLTDHRNTTEQVTGFLLRSQVVAGWPRLGVNGYNDPAGMSEIPKLRLDRLAADVLLCLFDGVVELVAIHEPPEQLHAGIENKNNNGYYTTTLRAVNGATPGKQYLSDPLDVSPDAPIPVRPDNQTLNILAAATSIKEKLNKDFGQGLTKFTSAELALELIKGVVKVEFHNEQHRE